MEINDLSYLEDISEVSSIKAGRQSTIVNVNQNAYAAAGNGDGIAIGNIATAINIAIINITNIRVKGLKKAW